ncbi:hypothetical protein KCW65_20625, partial [Mycobacterium tuberculosis]|nr:hypothetical protein [Mycobacterium tuberculosis]
MTGHGFSGVRIVGCVAAVDEEPGRIDKTGAHGSAGRLGGKDVAHLEDRELGDGVGDPPRGDRVEGLGHAHPPVDEPGLLVAAGMLVGSGHLGEVTGELCPSLRAPIAGCAISAASSVGSSSA